MRPQFHPHLINDDFEDPGLYIDFQFKKRAILFDLGENTTLSARKILRVSELFISHTHMDHFAGFDRLLRFCLGREKQLRLYGPRHFIDQVECKLGGYTWNLLGNYSDDFTLIVHEYDGEATLHRAAFSTSNDFCRRRMDALTVTDGVLLHEPEFQIRCVQLDHKIPCLAFALQEAEHVNVWKNRLDEMGLPTGPWLTELKHSVLHGAPDDTLIAVYSRSSERDGARQIPLGELKQQVLKIVPGQKIAYVVDSGFTDENQKRIVSLVEGADMLFIEAGFLHADAGHAGERYHLTARQAGELASRAGVKRAVPFHFSTRYHHGAHLLRDEFHQAYAGNQVSGEF